MFREGLPARWQTCPSKFWLGPAARTKSLGTDADRAEMSSFLQFSDSARIGKKNGSFYFHCLIFLFSGISQLFHHSSNTQGCNKFCCQPRNVSRTGTVALTTNAPGRVCLGSCLPEWWWEPWPGVWEDCSILFKCCF